MTRSPITRLTAIVQREWRRPERTRRWLFVGGAAWILGGACLLPPSSHGDGGEYHLMAESLLRHLSPEVRPGDVQSLALRERRSPAGINFAAALLGYFEAQDARWYSYHFWGYSLASVPARLCLRLLRLNDLKNGQVTNALLFLAVLYVILFRSSLRPVAAAGAALLVLFSPATWFVLWMHPESFCFSLVLLGLLAARAGARHLAVLLVALAAMQNPPLIVLLGVLWVAAVGAPGPRGRSWMSLARATLAAAPAVVPPVFFWLTFGTPSVIARESGSATYLSAGRAFELLVDLNLGLMPYLPVTLVLFVLGSTLGERQAARVGALALVVFVMAFACTATGNWNHGTAGPSRYAVWLSALILFGVAESYGVALEKGGRHALFWNCAVSVAILSQAGIVVMRGGLRQPIDSLTHSSAARVVLERAPAWYNPSPDVFVARTLGEPGATATKTAIFQGGDGRCRKAWLRPRDRGLLLDTCGSIPEAYRGFLDRQTRRGEWRYVDFE